MAIVEYISDDNPDAVQRVKDDIDAQIGMLPDFPKMGRAGRVVGTRELVVLSNYIVVYDEDPTSSASYGCFMLPNNGHLPLNNHDLFRLKT